MVVVHSEHDSSAATPFQTASRASSGRCAAEPSVTTVVRPSRAVVSRDGRTAVSRPAPARDPNDMVRAADELKADLERIGGE